MNSILKYRIVAVALVVVFGVFNIGIPIIVASCSMPQMMQSGRCPMCDEQDMPSTASLTTAQSTACCTTAIVAERNMNEFVRAKGGVSDFNNLGVLTGDVLPAFVLHSPIFVVHNVSSSPPAVVDIPILISSLLI